MLVKSSFNDSQVMYWEPAKYVAKMRALRTDHNTLLLKTDMRPAGHGGASGRYDVLNDKAFDYAFFLTQMGIDDEAVGDQQHVVFAQPVVVLSRL